MRVNLFLLAVSLFTTGALAQDMTATPTVASDAEIAKVLLTVNDGEIDAAKIELDKGKNKEAKDFAKTMVNAHKENMKETKALAKKLGLDPKDSPLSKSLKEQAKTANKDLKKADRAAFDKAYVVQQIDMHEKALSLLSDTLIPKADNADLKAHLQKTREAVMAHLEHAKTLQSQL